MKNGLFALLALAMATNAYAYDNSKPRFMTFEEGSGAGGTGCPKPEDVNIVVSEDGQSISFTFSKFYVENIRQTEEGKKVLVNSMNDLRRSCNLRIKTKVPAGFIVENITGDYRGYVNNPYGDPLMFKAEYFFAGTTGPKFETYFPGTTMYSEPLPSGRGYGRRYPADNVKQPKRGDFTVSNKLQTQAWSRCGFEPILAANLNISVPRAMNVNEEPASIGVDTADFSKETVYTYYLHYRQGCN